MRSLAQETFQALSTAEVEALMPAESTTTKVSFQPRMLEAFYPAMDFSNTWMVWSVASRTNLEENHQALPPYPSMQSKIPALSQGV